MTNTIRTGDAIAQLQEMDSGSIHMCMTSPPYWNLRDYGEPDQLGLEDTSEEFVENLADVFDEVKRVLHPDGSLWLNLGDTYDNKDLQQIPARVAIELQSRGWMLRNRVTWAKPNPMPSSVKDRLNTTTEQLFYLRPEPDGWFDLDAIREPYTTEHDTEPPIGGVKHEDNSNHQYSGNEPERDMSTGKNPGDVFTIPPQPYPDAHFAVYPPELCRKPIKSSCPPVVCGACGAPYGTEVETVPPWELDPDAIDREQTRRALELADERGLTVEHLEAARTVGIGDGDGGEGNPYDRVGDETAELARVAADVLGSYYREALVSERVPADSAVPTCDCDTDATEPGIVLDPFAGAGTTCLVAKRLGRRFSGIDLNPEYVAMAQKRVGVDVDQPEYLTDDGQAALGQFGDRNA